jgi:isochorismate synthase
MSEVLSALDSLLASPRSSAVYRIPGSPPVLLIQEDGDPEAFGSVSELNGRTGFVMAPFQADRWHPVVLLRPDRRLNGIEAICSYTSETGGETVAKPGSTGANRLDPLKDKEGFVQYQTAFDLFQKALHAGSCEKIVLSRTLQLPVPEGFSAGALFGAACEAYPDAFVYLCRTPQTGIWFGSTPELLLAGEDGQWQTVALAGTRRISTPASTDKKRNVEMVNGWDAKNRREQQVVTAYLEKQLRIKNLIGSISEPYTVKAGQLMHLKTDFRFQMPEQGNVGELLDFLHPTPAVCGYPKTEACRLILAHEGYERAYYTGFSGPLNLEGKTDLYVNLRCASMSDQGLVLYAGGGLMPDSELQSEWEETEVKLQTLLTLIQT